MLVKCKNYGASPAEVLKGEAMAVFNGEPFEDPPYFGTDVYAIAGEFISPGGGRKAVVPITLHTKLTEDDLLALSERRMFLYCYG